jgi:hypothetical protein
MMNSGIRVSIFTMWACLRIGYIHVYPQIANLNRDDWLFGDIPYLNNKWIQGFQILRQTNVFTEIVRVTEDTEGCWELSKEMPKKSDVCWFIIPGPSI